MHKCNNWNLKPVIPRWYCEKTNAQFEKKTETAFSNENNNIKSVFQIEIFECLLKFCTSRSGELPGGMEEPLAHATNQYPTQHLRANERDTHRSPGAPASRGRGVPPPAAAPRRRRTSPPPPRTRCPSPAPPPPPPPPSTASPVGAGPRPGGRYSSPSADS